MVFHLSVTRPGFSLDVWVTDTAQCLDAHAIAQLHPEDARLYLHDPDDALGIHVQVGALIGEEPVQIQD